MHGRLRQGWQDTDLHVRCRGENERLCSMSRLGADVVPTPTDALPRIETTRPLVLHSLCQAHFQNVESTQFEVIMPNLNQGRLPVPSRSGPSGAAQRFQRRDLH